MSLGVARVEGAARGYRGFNIWGGKASQHPALFSGKSYGILAIDSVLYMWVSPESSEINYERATVYRSSDYGASWLAATWAFVKSDGIILPTFLQFDKGYQGARDDFVYVYANHFQPNRSGSTDSLRVHLPGQIALMRTPRSSIMDRAGYELFSGLDSSGAPTWTRDLSSRVPVFRDPNGVGWNTSVSYNPGLDRYFLITEHIATGRGNVGVFDAPTPWGPWTTVKYVSAFGAPHIEPTTFFWNFSNKWLSAGGLHFTLIFTGLGGNDSWNTVRGTFVLRNPAAP